MRHGKIQFFPRNGWYVIAMSMSFLCLCFEREISQSEQDSTVLKISEVLQGCRRKSTVARKKAEAPAKVKSMKKAARETDVPVSPIEFGLQVAQSDKGQEAIGILIEGGLKFVDAVLDEGKKTKVVIPRGYDTNTGALKKPRIENVGYKQLLDAGIFAGQEFIGLAKTNYERFYVGGKGKGDVKVFRSKGKTDDRGNVIKDVTDNYFVNIGGQRVAVKRRLR